MKENELRVLLEEILKPSTWDIVIGITTLVLTASSIVVAIIVAIIYYKQSKIFEGQRQLNKQQLEIQRVELNNKRLESVPNFILSARIIRSHSDLFFVEEFILRIPDYSKVKEVQKVKIEINGINFPMERIRSMKHASYQYKPHQELTHVKAKSKDGFYSVEVSVKITTIIFDEFEKKYMVNLGMMGVAEEITEVMKELTYIGSYTEQ